MEQVTLSRRIGAAADTVWTLLVDVGRLPEISPSTVRIEGPRELASVGDRFEQTVRLAGREFTSTWSVTRIEPGRTLAVAGSVLPGTHYEMTEELRADGAGSTLHLTIAYALPFGPLGRLAAKLGAERRAIDEAREVLDGIARLAAGVEAPPRPVP